MALDSCSTFSGSGGSLGSMKNKVFQTILTLFSLSILPSSLSSVVPCCSPPAVDGIGANENFGGVKLIEDAELIDDLSVLDGLAKGEVNVDEKNNNNNLCKRKKKVILLFQIL